jgi:hypothetical protein
VTQFTVLFGSRHGTALETALALISLMGWLGLPECIHSDGGPEFDNYVWLQVMQITGIKHTLSVPNMPHSNPIAERNIGSAKRFIRSLTTDLDKHNAWGLLLPIAQKGLNDLRRDSLLWRSPNEVVFASFVDPDSFVLPTFYTREVNASDLADANTYTLSANLAHRAMCFQQMVCNATHHIHARAFEAAARKNPSICTELSPGQCVLIDWPDNHPPTPTHPKKRGPYRVCEIHHNSVSLQHLSAPPPADQPATIRWSKQAHVYEYVDDILPVRAAADPSASQVPTGIQQRHIECVLSASPLHASCRPPDALPNDVRYHMYNCRLHSTSASRQPPPTANGQIFPYDEIAHTHAFDVFFNGQSRLVGHVPVAFMPANWNPLAAHPSQRPAHPPLPPFEHSFPQQEADAHSQ